MGGQPAGTVRRLSSVPLVIKREPPVFHLSLPKVAGYLRTMVRTELAFLLLTAFLLGRISLLGQFHPFGIALAGGLLGRSRGNESLTVSLLVALGVLSAAGWRTALEYGAVLTLIGLGGSLLTESKPRFSRTILTGAVVTTSVLIARLTFSALVRGSLFDVGFIAAEAVMAGLLSCLARHVAPVVRQPLQRRAFSQEELVGLTLLLAMLAAGLAGIGYQGVSLGDTAVRWIVLAGAFTAGMGAGATLGVACGAIGTMLGNVPFYFIPGYALAGITAALFRDLGRLGAAAGFAIGTILLVYQIPDTGELTACLVSTGLAVAAFALTPRGFFAAVRPRVQGWGASDGTPAGVGDRLQNVLSEKLEEFAKVFRELAKTFRYTQVSGGASERPEFATLLEEIADRACVTCEASTNCWKEHFHLTYQQLLDLLTTAEAQGGLTVLDVPEAFIERCPQANKVIAAINHLVEVNKINSVWEKRVAESKQIVYGQLAGVAEIMQSLAREARVEPASRGDLEREVFTCLHQARFPADRVSVTQLDRDRLAVEISCRPCGGRERCRSSVPPLLDKSFGQVYSLYHADCGQEQSKSSCLLRYLPERAFDLYPRVAKAAKDGNTVSGDNHAVLDLPGGKVAVVLSDGMGMGAKAALESSATIDVLAQLMKAGFEREFAVRTVNSILLLRSQEETFATVDMILFDLYSGEVEFVKIGACPSYIVRGSEVQSVSGASVPIGILNNIDVEVTSRYLRPGDLVVMTTDGVSDVANETGAGDWIAHALRSCPPDDPAVVAQCLLAQARQLGGGKVEDDMTVVVCQVQRRADYCLPQPLERSWSRAGAV